MRKYGRRWGAVVGGDVLVLIIFLLGLCQCTAWIWSYSGLDLEGRRSDQTMRRRSAFAPYLTPRYSFCGHPASARATDRTCRLKTLSLLSNGGSGGNGRGSGGNGEGDDWNDAERSPIPAVVIAQWPPGAAEEDDADVEVFPGPEKSFSADQIPDVWDSKPIRRAVVTGANTGIGLEMAKQLASKGWHVVLACRSKERGETALEEIRSMVGPRARVELMQLDTGDPESVRTFARQYRFKGKPLHLLINNAGVMLNDFKVSAWGVEQTFAVNYLGPFLLTTLLLPSLRQAASTEFPTRVVNVASESLRFAPTGGIVFNVSQINDPELYDTMEDKWMWYGHSKIALSLFTKELNMRLFDEEIYINCCHPGLVKSDLFRESGVCFPPFFGWAGRVLSAAAEGWRRDVHNGALTPLYIATSPDVVKGRLRGEYVVPCDGWMVPDWLNVALNVLLTPFGVYLPPGLRLEPWSTGTTVVPVIADEPFEANDFQLAGKLWEFSCQLSEGGADMTLGKAETLPIKLAGVAFGAVTLGLTASNFARPTNMSNPGDNDRILDLKMPLVGNLMKQGMDDEDAEPSSEDWDDKTHMNLDKIGGF